MKVLMLLCIAAAILGAEFASAQDYLLTGSSGKDILLALLRESNGKLKLVNKTRQPAPGSVGVTSILATSPEDYHAYFTWTRSAGTPALGRISFSRRTWMQSIPPQTKTTGQ